MYKLKNVGPNIDPWGTHEIIFFKISMSVVDTNTLFPSC